MDAAPSGMENRAARNAQLWKEALVQAYPPLVYRRSATEITEKALDLFKIIRATKVDQERQSVQDWLTALTLFCLLTSHPLYSTVSRPASQRDRKSPWTALVKASKRRRQGSVKWLACVMEQLEVRTLNRTSC